MKARLQTAGIDCDGVVHPYEPAIYERPLSDEITETFACTVDGAVIEGWAVTTSTELDSAIVSLNEAACLLGMESFPYVEGDTWYVHARTTSERFGDPDSAAELATALGLPVSTLTCEG